MSSTPLAERIEDADSLAAALDEMNERGDEPQLAGMDSTDRSFLAYLAEVGGDETSPGVLFDEPHESAYALNSDNPCDHCGCQRRSWDITDLAYPVTVLRRRLTSKES